MVCMRALDDIHRELILLSSWVNREALVIWCKWKYSVNVLGCIVLLEKCNLCFLLPLSLSWTTSHAWKHVEDFPFQGGVRCLKTNIKEVSIVRSQQWIDITSCFGPIWWDWMRGSKDKTLSSDESYPHCSNYIQFPGQESLKTLSGKGKSHSAKTHFRGPGE